MKNLFLLAATLGTALAQDPAQGWLGYASASCPTGRLTYIGGKCTNIVYGRFGKILCTFFLVLVQKIYEYFTFYIPLIRYTNTFTVYIEDSSLRE